MRDGCGREGFVKLSRRKRYFFCHYVKTNCPGETEQHRAAKAMFAQLARRHVSQVAVEEGEGERRVDVVFTSLGGRRWAVEVQRSGQKAEITRKRSARLTELGFTVLWVFFSDRKLRELVDEPKVLHVATTSDDVAAVVHRSPQNQGGKPSLRTLSTPDLVKAMANDGAEWLPVAAFNHRIEGQAELRSFTCKCGVVSQFPYACPPCRHIAQCGTEVGFAPVCPEFDWWDHFRRNPAMVGESRPCKVIISARGRWRKCPSCDKGWIDDKRKPDDREPERVVTMVPLSLVLQSHHEPADHAHWCGLAGKRCRQPDMLRGHGSFSTPGQQTLF